MNLNDRYGIHVERYAEDKANCGEKENYLIKFRSIDFDANIFVTRDTLIDLRDLIDASLLDKPVGD